MSQDPNVTAPPPPTVDNLITILSIDGGGVRGIIPGVILGYLEEQLQEIDNNKNAKLADYFDVIAGTSTGGLVTTMLTAPKEPGSSEPKCAAKDIVDFYLNNAPRIFNQTGSTWTENELMGPNYDEVNAWMGPEYDGKELRRIIREELGLETRLSDTLTNVVIPAYDIKRMRPVIFSSFKVSKDPTINATMYDICVGTTAAPVYLPGHEFINDGRDFNLIDGGVAANNPTAVALEEVTRDVLKEFKDHEGKNHPYGKFLVLSLGTGAHNIEGKYDVKESSTWGVLGWVVRHGSPLIKIFTHASTELVDYRMNNVFDILGCPDNFLRIQDDTLSEDLSSLDKATRKHLLKLKDVGEKLLDKPVCRPNSETGDVEPVSLEIKNREALRKFAKQLSEERKKRGLKDLSDFATKKESVIPLLKKNMGIHD